MFVVCQNNTALAASACQAAANSARGRSGLQAEDSQGRLLFVVAALVDFLFQMFSSGKKGWGDFGLFVSRREVDFPESNHTCAFALILYRSIARLVLLSVRSYLRDDGVNQENRPGNGENESISVAICFMATEMSVTMCPMVSHLGGLENGRHQRKGFQWLAVEKSCGGKQEGNIYWGKRTQSARTVSRARYVICNEVLSEFESGHTTFFFLEESCCPFLVFRFGSDSWWLEEEAPVFIR